MHRFYSLACAVVAATSLVAACGSSDDSGSTNTGGTGATAGTSAGGTSAGGGSGDQKCASPTYADVTSQDFTSKAVAGKSCSGDSDLANICNQDLSTFGASCGKTCLLQAGSDDAAQATCVATCIDQNLTTPLSDGCMTCYTTDVACARKECLAQCALAPTSDVCMQCRIDMGCLGAFYDCSGAPVPTGVDLGSAGAGNTGDAGGGS